MNLKVLIVEDEFVTAHALRLLLEEAGYAVVGIASSVIEADEYLKRQHPDIVLLDIRLEGKQSGIDLAKQLQEENIPFVYLSANSSQKVLEEAKKTEPYGFLVKPYREKDVLVALDIAHYRHKNSFESKSRYREILKHQLDQITDSGQLPLEKLLSAAKALQSYLPFDLLLIEETPSHTAGRDLFGYLRTGYDEYHLIRENMFTPNSCTLAQSHSLETTVVTLNSGHIEDTAFHKILAGNFGMRSYLAFPFTTESGKQLCLYFCSRRNDIYQNNHKELISDLYQSLSILFSDRDNDRAAKSTGHDTSVATIHTGLFEGIIGSHPLLLAALDLTKQVAPFNTSVLILGESGTGKEKIAEAIHTGSLRSGPLVKLNCAAIPASLIESELFGYEKGAFTGATESKKGKFEAAEGGTLFLDEIGELSLELQIRLLRVLQEREIDPVGSTKSRKIDVRIIAATNRNLEKAIGEGSFRLDLYYRLNIFPITLPALRERKSDIISLANYFAQRFSKVSNRNFIGISPEMAQALVAYEWPGNIRELENVMQRSVILNDGKTTLQLHSNLNSDYISRSQMQSPESFEDVKNLQRETEREYIMAALTKAAGRIRGDHGAAALLNIKPTTLESKMAKLGICREDFKT